MSESSPVQSPLSRSRLPVVVALVAILVALAAIVSFGVLQGGVGEDDAPAPAASDPVVTVDQQEGSSDVDNDGLTAMQERQYQTDPNLTDSDDDGFTDGEEVRGGFNPAGPGKQTQTSQPQ